MTSKRKVIVFGLDGATFDIIYPMVEKGELPTICRLIDEGTHGVLQSTIPNLSPVAWTSMITGKKPGNHAIFDFLSHQPGSYNFKSTQGGNRKVKPIWSYLSEKGKRVGAINVTMSYPPEEVNGFIVSGLDSPGLNSTFTYPPSLYNEIKEKLGRYLLVNPYALTTREKHLQGMFEMLDNRLASTKYLMERYEWDFFMTVFIATDGAQHFYWKDMDTTHPDHDIKTPEPFKKAVFNVYAKLDKGIGELLEQCGGEITVMMVSDHGFQPLHKLFVLNNWLMEEGYLSLKKRIMSSANLGKLIALGGKVKDRLRLGSREKTALSNPLSQSIDWGKTKAFADGTFGNLFINLRGREPQGTVNPGREYDELCDEIIKRLKEVRDPDTGQLVVEDVYRRKEIFNGPHINDAPDLIVTSRQNYFASASSERLPSMQNMKNNSHKLFQKHVWSGNHESNGIFIIKGPDVQKGHKIQGARIIDIAPTILYLLDLEIPIDMDGSVLMDVFTREHIDDNKPKFTEVEHFNKPLEESLSDEDAAVKERLRDLGYLD